MDLGYAAKKAICELKKTFKGVNEASLIQVRKAAKRALIIMAGRLVEKSPLAYSSARAMVWLNPNTMATKEEDCIPKSTTLLDTLLDSDRIVVTATGKVLTQMRLFISENKQDLLGFSQKSDRLDFFLHARFGLGTFKDTLLTVISCYIS